MLEKLLRRLRSRRGQAIIEFVVIFPLFIMLLAGIVDFSIAFDRRITLQHAVREGARHAAVNTDVDSIRQTTAAQAQGLVGEGNVCVEYVGDERSAGDQVTVSAKFDYRLKFIGPILSGLFDVFDFDDTIEMRPSGTSRIEIGGTRLGETCLPTTQLPVPTVTPP